jgi:hypothetical protein
MNAFSFDGTSVEYRDKHDNYFYTNLSSIFDIFWNKFDGHNEKQVLQFIKESFNLFGANVQKIKGESSQLGKYERFVLVLTVQYKLNKDVNLIDFIIANKNNIVCNSKVKFSKKY